MEFNKERAKRYLKAMFGSPLARNSEFAGLKLSKFKSNKIIKIIDLGAGEGYLAKHLSKNFPNATIYSIDKSSFMLSHIPKKRNISLINTKTSKLPFKEDSIDLGFSLAVFHHIHNKKEVFKEISRVLKKKGYFVIGDVEDKTNVQEFFDNVVAKYCITKHNLPFLNKDKVKKLAEQKGLKLIKYKIKNTPWKFDTEEELYMFVKNIFGLEIDNETLRNQINKYFKIKKSKNKIILPWKLSYYFLRK